jgi:hypothetical protein
MRVGWTIPAAEDLCHIVQHIKRKTILQQQPESPRFCAKAATIFDNFHEAGAAEEQKELAS